MRQNMHRSTHLPEPRPRPGEAPSHDVTGERRAITSIVASLLALFALMMLGCSKDPTGIVKQYLNQESCLDRSKFILDPEANRPALAEYYKDVKSCVKPFETLKPDGCDQLAEGDYCSVEAAFGKNGTDYYHLKKTTDGLKIDWRSSTAYNPESLAAFEALRSKTPQLFRLWAKIDSYYNFDYSDAEKTHQSIRVADSTHKTLWGYIRKSAPTAAALFDELKDGKEHAVMLELVYLPNSDNSSVVEIRRLVGQHWRQTPEEFENGASSAAKASTTSTSTAAPSASAAARKLSACEFMASIKMKGEEADCAKLISCCCAGNPPDLLGKSNMADVVCLGAPGELLKTDSIYDCKQWRQKVAELYKIDGKQPPATCR